MVERVNEVDGHHRQMAIFKLAIILYRADDPQISKSYHQQCPNGIVDEDDGCYNEHGETDETIKLELIVSV